MTSPASRQEHWNTVHATTPAEQTGWYEAVPAVSLDFLDQCGLAPDDTIMDVGSGVSTFIEALAGTEHPRIIAVDISQVALDQLAERLGERAREVTFVCDDITKPAVLLDLAPVALWHDRAVLHFLTDEKDRDAYRRTLETMVAPGGHAIIAAFSLDGVSECSGLPVRQYDEAMLAEVAGPQFETVASRRHIYQQPSGDERPYVYVLFRRQSEG